MSFHEIVIALMAGFALLGAIDRIFGNRWGLGKEFEEGILAMGSLALAMVGIVSFAPVLAALLKPVVVPIYGFLGADPAMFAGTLLACDMGGGALAVQMTTDYQAAMLVIQQEVPLFDWNYTKNHTLQEEEKTKTVQ